MAQRSPNDIPDIVIGRLPIYLRALRHMAQEGLVVTSSHELGQRLGISGRICPILGDLANRAQGIKLPFWRKS